MKKLLLFVIACTLGLFGTVSAQETITIGNEEEAIRSYSVPFDLYNGYGVCQQLYTADEIGKTAGAIESLALKFVGPTGTDMQTPANQDQVVVDFEIYVENTTMTTLSAFQVVETGDLYFSGKQPMESDAWTTFEFSNSFEYDGTNLLITIYCVGDKYEMKTDNNFYPFYIYTTNSVQCLSASPENKPIAGASFNGLNQNSGKNILQLTFAAAGEGGEEGGEEEGGEELASEFSFDFEDGTLTGLRVFQGEGATGNNWQVTADGDTYYTGQANSKGIYSVSWDENSYTQFYPNNYVVTEQAYQITENSVLSWFMRYTYLQYGEFDKYEVVASEDGTNFDMVLWEGDGNGPNSNTLSLAEYAGKALYLGFRHYAESDPGDALVLDNIVLTAGEGGEEPTPEPEPEGPVTITIGEGTYATTSAPIANQASYTYSYSQQIYLKEEIGKANGLITSIAFHNKLGGSNTRNIVVYANNTEKSSYATDGELTNLVTVSASDIVYEGEFTFGANETWSTIELQTPFVYTGENLVITVNDKTGVAKGYDGYDQFYATATTNQRCLYFGSYTEVEENMANKSYLSNLTVGGWGSSTPGIPDVQLTIAPLAAGVLVSTETIAFGDVQLGEYWSEKEDVTVSVSVMPIMTTVTNITCDEDFFVLPTIDLTASPIEFEVAYNKNAAAGEYTGNLTITYGDGATKVVPMTATAYTPATPDVFELAQEITFTENAYTDTPVFANLKDDYNLPAEEGANAPDAVYAFELAKESTVAVEVTGTNANYAIYKAEDLVGNGPKADNNYAGEKVATDAPVSFFYDFSEENVLDNFTLLDNDNDGYIWRIAEGSEYGVIDGKTLKSDTYKSGNLYPDNYIVTKEKYEITTNSVLSFKHYTSTYPDKLGVEVSTDGVNFTSVWSEKSGLGKVVERVIPLSEYAGQSVYIALRHYESNGVEGYYVTVDDLRLESGLPNSFPAGNYYLVAAAEDAFTVNVAIGALETEEPVAPAAPTNVAATANGQNSIIVTWNAVDGAAYYIVYKDGQMWDQVNGTTYTSTGLTAGTEYCYAVQAYDANGLESELSDPVCATTEAEVEVELPENQVLVGEATTSYLSPFVTALGNAWVEMIYKAEEIGKAGKIAEIAYSYNNGSEVTADIDIYFAEVTKSVFASPADVTPVTDLTLVYSGTGVTLCDSEWETFVLDTQFEYSGENNLLVVVATSNTSGQNHWNSYSEANTVLIKDTMLEHRKPVMLLTLAEEGGNDEPVDDTKYRLVSTGEGWRAVTYVYESETSDKVIEIREGEDSGYGQSITFLQYDENGVLTGYEYGWAENGEIVKSGSSYQYTGVEYTYTEGVLTAYTETQYTGWAEPDATEYTITRDAEGNVTEVAYGTSQIVYTYENGKLASETKSYYNQWASTPGYETEYIIEYTYDENGNCTVATQYSAYDGEKVARKATEYNYALTIPAENVTAFAYPQEVVPAHANLITRAIDYTFNEDWQTNEIVKSVENVTTYKYNPEVEMEPLAPMALTVSAVSDTELRLSWYSAETAEKFYIYKDGEFYAESTSDTYYAEGLEPSTEYCFSVSAVNGETESPKSEVVCGKTLGLVAFYPAELEFGEVRVGNYWAKEETTVLVEIDMLGKTATSITSDNAFFTVPANIDLTASYIMFDLGYDKTAEAGEYTGNIVVTLEGGATVTAPVTATAYAPVTPDVFELAQEITFTEGVYTDTPDFATLHDDYLMPEENEWNDGELMDAVYTFTLDTPSAVTVNVTGQNAQYAIYQAEGFEYPTEETYAGVDRAITTEFSFNFNDGELGAFTIKDNDEYQDYTWDVEEDENGGYKLVSYSYNGWYDENNQWVYIADADERIITNEAYNITAQSVLTFDMHVNGNFEGVIIEVTKDGETFTTIENIMETSYSWDWLAKRVNIGAKLAELGLEYGEYRISLYHDMQGYGELNIDNLVLAEREFAFPEGTYYLFAAAEDEFSVEVVVAETEEVVIVPDPKAYRLESVESFMSTVYTYDEVFTNRVVTMEKEGITSTFTYNKAGQIETIVDTYPGEDEEGNPILDVINTVEYVYNEDGTIATYSEATAGWEPMVTEFTYEDGKLVKTVIAEYEMEVTFAYNAEGLLSEKVTSYSGETESKETYTYDAEGRLVDYGYYGYDARDLLDYYLSEGVTYTYNAKGNCATAESYQIFEGEKLYFQTVKYFYDETIANEDVYSFELPHVAVTNVAPAQANVLVKELSYYTEHTENGESINHTYIMSVYNYNPAIILAPVTPMNFTAEVVDGAVELTWEAFADAETFTVYQDGEVLAENVVDGSYTVEGLAAGEYCFVVRAYNAAGASATTEEECVTIEGGEPTPTVPAAPVVTVKEVTSTTIILEWAAVEGAVDYILYYGTKALGNTEGETIAGIQGLEPETEYCYTVTAVNAEGLESEHSEAVCATTKPDGIAENTAALNIYPNPVVDRLVIETEANIESVAIYTVTGVMIYSEVDFNNNTINVSDLTSGVYVMKVRTENGEVVKRFIKK